MDPGKSDAGRLALSTRLVIATLALAALSANAQPPASAIAASAIELTQLGAIEYAEIDRSQIDNVARQLLVFVHGTPGSYRAFNRYLTDTRLQQRFHMIAVTRPGWVDANDDKQPSLEVQATALEPLLRRDRSGKGALLMGHSYGGPVIARTAMDYPDLVAGLIFVASTGDPQLSGPRWYNRAATLVPRFLLGANLKGANAEIMPLREQLEAMLPRWQDVQMPVLIVQGDRDRLVHPDNARFLTRVLVNAQVTLLVRQGQGHFLLWEEAELIRDSLLELYVSE